MPRRGLFAVVAVGALLVGGCDLLSEAAVDSGEVENRIGERLESEVGEAPADVDCPEDLPADLEASMRCTITAEDGSQIGVTVSVSGIDGNTVDLDIEVDDEPM